MTSCWWYLRTYNTILGKSGYDKNLEIIEGITKCLLIRVTPKINKIYHEYYF